MPQPTAVVIGAGLGGLSAALHLSTRGWRVVICEANGVPGGKLNIRSEQGYTFDTGPSLLTMPSVVEDLFRIAGENIKDYLNIEPIDPVCRYYWPDGTILDASSDPDTMAARIDAFAPGQGASWLRYLDYSRRIWEATNEVFLFTPIHEPSKVLRAKYLPALFSLPRIDGLRTVHTANTSFFADPRLVQLADRYATYNGSDPFVAPATLNIIPWVEYGIGGFYIRGGMYKLATALQELLTRRGVECRYGARVRRISHDGTRATGVVLEDGTRVDADAVVCNSDVVDTYEHLLTGFEPRTRKLKELEPSISGMVFLWGVRGHREALPHHTIFFSSDYQKEFNQIFTLHQAPDEPTVYVAITSKKDPEMAPPGCENWFVLVNMPYDTGQDWPSLVPSVRASILSVLARHGFHIESEIECEQVMTPRDLRSLYRSNKGSIYGISSNTRTTAFKRPPNRSRDLQGLYFCGGSSHPGGGIPLVLLSGGMAAMLADERRVS